MVRITKVMTVVVVCVAMTAPAFGAADEWSPGGVDILWSNTDNWDCEAGPGVLPSIKTVIGEQNYGNAALNTVTLDFAVGTLPAFEVYGAGVLNIMPGGSLTVDDGDRGIYIAGGDAGSAINLLGGSLTVIDMAGDGFFNLDVAMFGEGGGTLTSGTGINIDTSVSGQTTYTATPEPATMSLLALGGLALIRRRRRS